MQTAVLDRWCKPRETISINIENRLHSVVWHKLFNVCRPFRAEAEYCTQELLLTSGPLCFSRVYDLRKTKQRCLIKKKS